jgi:2-dehydro-3-deoxyphosphogluconate aldolase/(4S)-4-hydroxy-2-oxoglutarate aldolase
MKNNKVIAVVRFDDIKLALDFSQACIDGGIKLLEVITIKNGSLEIIEELSKLDDVIIGAGTVLNPKTAENAYLAGAKFIVSPHTDPEVIEFTKSKGLTSIAGAFTSSEIVKAHNKGADYVKVFPASTGGPGYIKAIKEALPFVNILVTGGINIQNAEDYITAGASLLGISTALTGKGDSFQIESVRANAKKIIDSLK